MANSKFKASLSFMKSSQNIKLQMGKQEEGEEANVQRTVLNRERNGDKDNRDDYLWLVSRSGPLERGAHLLPSQSLLTKPVWILRHPKGQKIQQSSLENRAITVCLSYLF